MTVQRFPENLTLVKSASWSIEPVKSKSCCAQLVAERSRRCAAVVRTKVDRTSLSLGSLSRSAGADAEGVLVHRWGFLQVMNKDAQRVATPVPSNPYESEASSTSWAISISWISPTWPDVLIASSYMTTSLGQATMK
jgi:hypothetical protein